MDALHQIDAWDVPFAAAGVTRAAGNIAIRGDTTRAVRLASLSKPVTALAVLVAAEEGVLDLDDAAGPPGSTVRHLLAHASGLPFDGTIPVAQPGRRRIYSNEGFRLVAGHLAERAEMPFVEYVRAAVVEPLGRELLAPRLVAEETHAEMVSVQFPGLDGVLPDFGRFRPLDWGLGVELKGEKAPHWSGSRTSPATFGHFGGSGTFLWVDPERELACAVLTRREFGDWAKEAWPRLSDAVLEEIG